MKRITLIQNNIYRILRIRIWYNVEYCEDLFSRNKFAIFFKESYNKIYASKQF